MTGPRPPALPRLHWFDIALAVPIPTLNTALARAFTQQGAAADWTAVINADHGMTYHVRCGAPTLAVDDTFDGARLSFHIVDGTWQGGRIWNVTTQALDTIVEKLSGHDLTLSLALAQMSEPSIDDQTISVRHLYVDLTAIKAIDTTAHDINPGDPTLATMITAFVRALQASPVSANGSLFALTTTTRAAALTPTGPVPPFTPTAAAYGLVTDTEHTHQELLSLMMCGARALPTDAIARIGSGPWTAAGADATLVLSGRRILEALVQPALTTVMSIDAGSATLVEATDFAPARLVCTKQIDSEPSDEGLYYFRHSATTEVDASLVFGNVVIAETTTITADAYGKLGEYKLSQQLGSTTELAALLSGDRLSLASVNHHTWSGDVQTPESSGLIGLAGGVADLFGSLPKNLVVNPVAFTSALGTVAFPLADVSLPGTEGFTPVAARGVSDALVVDLKCS